MATQTSTKQDAAPSLHTKGAKEILQAGDAASEFGEDGEDDALATEIRFLEMTLSNYESGVEALKERTKAEISEKRTALQKLMSTTKTELGEAKRLSIVSTDLHALQKNTSPKSSSSRSPLLWWVLVV